MLLRLYTPSVFGTATLVAPYGLLVVHASSVQGRKEVVVLGDGLPAQRVRVLFTDARLELAFLEKPLALEAEGVPLIADPQNEDACSVTACAYPEEGPLERRDVELLSINKAFFGVGVWLAKPRLPEHFIGAPLLDAEGHLAGLFTPHVRGGQAIAAPAKLLRGALDEYEPHSGLSAARCLSCRQLVTEKTIDVLYCPKCGGKVILPERLSAYEPLGTNAVLEQIIARMGHDPDLARRGDSRWELLHGSAHVHLRYQPKEGYVLARARLCRLPKGDSDAVCDFLLRENCTLEDMAFSLEGDRVTLGAAAYDHYLQLDDEATRFRVLLEKADYYDDLLVSEMGCVPFLQ